MWLDLEYRSVGIFRTKVENRRGLEKKCREAGAEGKSHLVESRKSNSCWRSEINSREGSRGSMDLQVGLNREDILRPLQVPVKVSVISVNCLIVKFKILIDLRFFFF